MSNIDKQSLRTAAENATPGEWCTDDYHGVIADAGLNANYYISSCSGPDNRSNKRFIAAANPATVLALLDELEAAEKRIAEMEARQVVVPDVSNDEFWLKFNTRIVFREETYRTAVFKALDDAGINNTAAAAAGKGEAS
ncbi:ead/Ea22-like family protein [Enterobacter hormaechei]|nr:ead/Ea22-like family protein [Enterobacter hormaechei]